MLPLFDTHAHLEQLEHIDEAISQARSAGVAGILAVGMDYQSNHNVLELAARYPDFVHAALGLHPWEVAGEMPHLYRSLSFIEDNIQRSAAIGEVGLDYDKRVLSQAEKDVQQRALHELLFLAKKHDKPVSFHSRYSWKDSLNMVLSAGLTRVAFHWFTGFSSVLSDLLAAGYFISATPAAEYHQEHRRAIREAPLSQLMLETDSPVQYGRENRFTSAPRDIVRSLAAVAEIKGADRDVVAQTTTENALDFFRLRPSSPP